MGGREDGDKERKEACRYRREGVICIHAAGAATNTHIDRQKEVGLTHEKEQKKNPFSCPFFFIHTRIYIPVVLVCCRFEDDDELYFSSRGIRSFFISSCRIVFI